MNNKIIAISLLLSFLMVLVHVVIPHHHHEGVMVEYSSTCERTAEDDVHDGDTCATEAHNQAHSHTHSSQTCIAHGWQEHLHDHTHNHPVTDCHALDIARRSSDTELSRLNRILLPLFVSAFLDIPLPVSENNTKTFYTEYYPLFCSLFVPEANALRGPPSLA